MTGQLSLDPATAAVKLTARQQHALTLIAQLGPIPSSELGAHMHERRGVHGHETRCTFCRAEGKSVADALRKKGLVRIRRGEGWYAVEANGKPQRKRESSGYNPATTPWPDGY